MKKTFIYIVISLVVLGLSVFVIVNTIPKFFNLIGFNDDLQKIPLAEDFTTSDYEGEIIKLSDFRGKKTILVFWTSWNSVSVEGLRILNDYYLHYALNDIEIVAINSQEDLNITKKIRIDEDLNIQMLIDEDGAIGELYDISVLPFVVFVNKSGQKAKTLVGPISLEKIEEAVATLGK